MYKEYCRTDNLAREQWLAVRKNGIGGSDASIVCGLNKYKSPVALWMEKTGQMESVEAGEAAYWGNIMEPVIRREFSLRTSIEVEAVSYILQSESHPFMLANLDGVCTHPDYGKCIFEAKNASAFKSGEWENGIPEAYMLQIQHYMAVTGYPGTYIAVLIGGNTFQWQFVHRDEELIRMLIALESDFWRHVEENIPPKLDGSEASAKLLNQLYESSQQGSRLELPDEAQMLIAQYYDAAARVDQYTEEKRLAENHLKEMLDESECGHVGDFSVAWKSVTQERLDSKALKSDFPDLYKQYARSSAHRRFSIREVRHGA